VALDVVEVGRVAEGRLLIEHARVVPQARIVDQAANVALEVAVVHGVEAHERGEQADVGFGEPVAHQVAARRQPFLHPVEPGEHEIHGALVHALRGREAGHINTVI
jgi:hypothetical protein